MKERMIWMLEKMIWINECPSRGMIEQIPGIFLSLKMQLQKRKSSVS